MENKTDMTDNGTSIGAIKTLIYRLIMIALWRGSKGIDKTTALGYNGFEYRRQDTTADSHSL